MKYYSGEEARLGDRVKLGTDENGIVVCSIDTNEYSDEFPVEVRDVFHEGVVIKFQKFGIIHYVEPEPDLILVARRNEVEHE